MSRSSQRQSHGGLKSIKTKEILERSGFKVETTGHLETAIRPVGDVVRKYAYYRLTEDQRGSEWLAEAIVQAWEDDMVDAGLMSRPTPTEDDGS